MKEIKVKVENVFNDGDHEIADYFVNAVKNDEVKNFKYKVCKDGDCNFSFERKNKKYVMDPEMSPYYAMEIIELFQKTAFKFIHKKQEKLSRLIERFKKDKFLNLLFHIGCNMYDVETVIGVEDNVVCRNKYLVYDSNGDFYYDYTKATDDEAVINTFVFTWYDDYSPSKQKSDDEIDEIIKENGGVRFYVTYDDYDFEGCIRNILKRNYLYMNKLVEVQLPKIRKIVTETYFEEEEENINEEKS